MKQLNNCEDLHESNKTWKRFLSRQKWVDEYNSYLWFNNSNCHWFVYPDGTIKEFFGYHGHNHWMLVTGKDRDEVYNIIRQLD